MYDDIGAGSESDVTRPRPGELPDDSAGIGASGLFDDVQVLQYDWEIRYDAESYIALLAVKSTVTSPFCTFLPR